VSPNNPPVCNLFDVLCILLEELPTGMWRLLLQFCFLRPNMHYRVCMLKF
jgi:hypothetical protein